jgi:hypothetical protein
MKWLIADLKRLRGTEPIDWRVVLLGIGCWSMFIVPLGVMFALQQWALPYHWVAG